MMGYPSLPDFMDLGEFLFDDEVRVLGPYSKSNGRQFVIVHNYVYTKTLSYPRYLWMVHHQQVIPDGYEVDHIDDDFTNNEISNLQLLTKDENNRKRDKHLGYSSDGYTFNCPVCGTERTIKMWIYRQNQIVKGQPGPYCSKSCSVQARYNQIVKPGRSTNVAEVRFVGSMVWFNCPYCGTESAIRRWVYNQNQIVKGQPGPYCSKSCSVKDRPKGWASKKVGDLNAISEL